MPFCIIAKWDRNTDVYISNMNHNIMIALPLFSYPSLAVSCAPFMSIHQVRVPIETGKLGK